MQNAIPMLVQDVEAGTWLWDATGSFVVHVMGVTRYGSSVVVVAVGPTWDVATLTIAENSRVYAYLADVMH